MEAKHALSTAVLILICLVLATPSIIHLHPPLVGADESYTVLSGSMTPTLNPGDLVFVRHIEPATINVNDIMTIKSEIGIFTHRVVEKKLEDDTYLFKTKGDANEDPDSGWISGSQIIGKHVFTIPLGHLYTPYGYILSFLIPCILLIGKQIRHILFLYKRRSKKQLRRWKRQKHPLLDTTSLLLFLILVMNSAWLIAPRLLGR